MREIKLFVPLGTQKFPFGRLIEALNILVDKGIYLPDEIVMQSTMYPIEPKFKHVGLIPTEQFDSYMREAEVVITHSGVNSIISCMRLGKPLLIAPRRGEFGEHVDDHQVEIAQVMKDKYDVLVLFEFDHLEERIKEAKTHKYKEWISHRDTLISAIKELIE